LVRGYEGPGSVVDTEAILLFILITILAASKEGQNMYKAYIHTHIPTSIHPSIHPYIHAFNT
jgi:hypothetical protein